MSVGPGPASSRTLAEITPIPAGAPLLVLNAGSTGLKASLHDGEGLCLWRGQRSWQELGGAPGRDGRAPQAGWPRLAAWLEGGLQAWAETRRVSGGDGPVSPALVGHRVVHGGERFTAPTPLGGAELAALEALIPLAPLHNPPALALIRWAQAHWPGVPQWACFDTAFHASLPPEAFTYAIPASWRHEGLRRFGFHGLNHQHLAQVVAKRFRPATTDGPLRLISCHLGGGCSLCAIEAGRSIATTMGFTPLEGLVMATRSGSLDPGLLLHQLRRGHDLAELERALQQEGGLLGLSQLSAEMRELRAAAAPPPAGHGHPGAALAIAVFRRRLLEGIGAMAACLRGVDVIALSGGIGEHDQALRRELEVELAWLAPFELVVVPADEEGVIARSCLAAAGQSGC